MSSRAQHPLAIGKDASNIHYAVVETSPGTYQVWRWLPPSHRYDTLTTVSGAEVVDNGDLKTFGGSNGMMVMLVSEKLMWRGRWLEWLEPSAWDIFTADSGARTEHLIGAPIRRDSH